MFVFNDRTVSMTPASPSTAKVTISFEGCGSSLPLLASKADQLPSLPKGPESSNVMESSSKFLIVVLL